MLDSVKNQLQKITWGKAEKSDAAHTSARGKGFVKKVHKQDISRPQPAQLPGAALFDTTDFLDPDPFARRFGFGPSHSTPTLVTGDHSGASTEVNTPIASRTPTGPQPRPILATSTNRSHCEGPYQDDVLEAYYASSSSVALAGPDAAATRAARVRAQEAPGAPAQASTAAPLSSNMRRLMVESGTFGTFEPSQMTASPSLQSMSSTDSYRDLTVTTHVAQKITVRHGVVNVMHTAEGLDAAGSSADDSASATSRSTCSSFGDVLPHPSP